jgi:hypothetical protein
VVLSSVLTSVDMTDVRGETVFLEVRAPAGEAMAAPVS